jgi:hypothetical protein
VLGLDVDVGEAFEISFTVEFHVRVGQKQAGMLGKDFWTSISPGCLVLRIEAPVSGLTTSTSMPRAWTCISPIRRGPVESTATSEVDAGWEVGVDVAILCRQEGGASGIDHAERGEAGEFVDGRDGGLFEFKEVAGGGAEVRRSVDGR